MNGYPLVATDVTTFVALQLRLPRIAGGGYEDRLPVPDRSDSLGDTGRGNGVVYGGRFDLVLDGNGAHCSQRIRASTGLMDLASLGQKLAISACLECMFNLCLSTTRHMGMHLVGGLPCCSTSSQKTKYFKSPSEYLLQDSFVY